MHGIHPWLLVDIPLKWLGVSLAGLSVILPTYWWKNCIWWYNRGKICVRLLNSLYMYLLHCKSCINVRSLEGESGGGKENESWDWRDAKKYRLSTNHVTNLFESPFHPTRENPHWLNYDAICHQISLHVIKDIGHGVSVTLNVIQLTLDSKLQQT